jgi:hypothetical protein
MSFELNYQEFRVGPHSLWSSPVPWDSQTFGFQVLTVDFVRSISAIRAGGLVVWKESLPRAEPILAILKAPTDEVVVKRSLADAGFYPVETMFQLGVDFDDIEADLMAAPDGEEVRLARIDDRSRLMDIAESAVIWDRSHLDPHIPYKAADERMRRWIADGVERGEPIFVLIDESSGSIIGLFYVRPAKDGVGYVSLVAIDPGFSGPDRFPPLVFQAFRECQRMGIRKLDAHVSGNNSDALNLGINLRFRVVDSMDTWHLFLPVMHAQA